MGSHNQRKRRQFKRLLASLGIDSGPSVIQFGPADVEILQAEQGSSQIPSFSSVAYSGGKLFVAGFKHPVVVDLSGLELNDNVNILLDHKPSQRVGHPTQIDITASSINAAGVISADSSSAREVTNSHKNGFRWHFSIGARIIAGYTLPDGKQAVVNQQVVQGPAIIATQSKLNEISFVGVGGDEGNQVRIAAAHTGANAMTFSEWLKQNGYTESELTADQLKPLKAAYALEFDDDGNAIEGDTSSTPPARSLSAQSQQSDSSGSGDSDGTGSVGDVVQQQRLNAAAESRRISAVSTILADHDELRATAIEEGWDEVRAELEQLRADRDSSSSNNNSGGAAAGQVRMGAPMNSAEAIEASLCLQFGIPESDVGGWYNEQTMNAAMSREYRGITLHQLMYRTLHAAGRHFVAGRIDDETIREFLRADRDLQASAPGNFSHLATSGILSNTANKRLLQAFSAVNAIVPTIFGVASVSDFKVNTAYRLAANGELEEVTGGGEIRHADLDEESMTNQAKTWGKMLTLTRKDMINDDLRAFNQIPQALGRKAALKREKEGLKKLLNPAAGYFTAANSFSGAGTALQISSLTTAEKAFADQVDKSGDPILLNARYLVTGNALRVTADQLMTETRIIATDHAAAASTVAPANNPHAGKWTPLTSPYVSNTTHGLTNASDTLWHLIGDPADEPAFVVSYLNGRQVPIIESSDVDFNRLGMSWRVVYDFGIDEQESRACVRMVGA